MTKTVGDFLRALDASFIAIYYDDNDKLWSGYMSETPFWITELELDYKGAEKDETRPVDYRKSLGEEYDNKSGLIIRVK